jgi:hypothetical protein
VAFDKLCGELVKAVRLDGSREPSQSVSSSEGLVADLEIALTTLITQCLH